MPRNDKPKFDITGQKFGRLTAIRPVRMPKLSWVCICECDGKEVTIESYNLRHDLSQSCGCLALEALANRATHGMSETAEYRAWGHMKSRCTNPNTKDWPEYGGRGIKVCDRWLNSFENFFADMGPRPSSRHSIDRFPDENGNYEPGNVRWATPKEQSWNTRRNVMLTFQGETLPATEWCRRYGLSDSVLHYRLKRGWTVERAIATPTRKGVVK